MSINEARKGNVCALTENILISVLTGLTVAFSAVKEDATFDSINWLFVISLAIPAFAGSMINGLRQIQKEPNN